MNSYYKYCIVPQCKSTTIKTPDKLFIYVPNNQPTREKWLTLASRSDAHCLSKSSNRRMYFCEDHFNLPNDMLNYTEYHIMGKVSQVRMIPGCTPSKFECQEHRRKRKSNSTKLSNILKKQRMAIIEECLNKPEESCAPSSSLKDTPHTSSDFQTVGQNEPEIICEQKKCTWATQPKKKTSRPQRQECDPLQEFANDSTNKESTDIKDESTDEADLSDYPETKIDTFTETVFSKSLKYSEPSDYDGTRSKRFDVPEVPPDYAEQYYEFGKFVAEQLMCLDIEDARVAQIEIRDLLMKLHENKHRVAEIISNIQPETERSCRMSTLSPVASSVNSGSKVNTAKSSVTHNVTTSGAVVSQYVHLRKTAGPSVTHSVTLNTTRSSMTQSLSQANTRQPVARPSLIINPLRPLIVPSKPIHISSSSKFAVLYANPFATRQKVIVPRVTVPGYLTTQLLTERPPVTQCSSKTSVGSTETQTESIAVKTENITETSMTDLESYI